jgi:hypothetical protein
VVSSTKVEAELLRRNGDGSWPESPEGVGPGGDIRLESIGFTAALKDFYRTTALAAG